MRRMVFFSTTTSPLLSPAIRVACVMVCHMTLVFIEAGLA
jgi:hypothetical protein